MDLIVTTLILSILLRIHLPISFFSMTKLSELLSPVKFLCSEAFLSYLICIFIFVTGPIQFSGAGSNAVNHTLLLELGAQAAWAYVS